MRPEMPGRGETGPRLRVMSANLCRGNADPARLIALIRRLAPDAVLFQELTDELTGVVTAVMPEGRLEPGPDYTGMGIALRAPAAVRRLSLPYRDALVAEVAVAGLPPVEILNVHVMAPHVPPPWRLAERRGGQLRGLERHLETAPARARVLMGDLNATPSWPLYRRLVTRLADAAVLAAQGNGHRPRPTWGPGSWAPRLLRIDHVLVSGLTVLGCQVLDIPGSDHSAVVVDVRP